VAAAHDVLEALPEGLDAQVDEAGRGFSGGQRQRLALARALLSDSDVLVLVEPTSAVDAHTEVRVAERLKAARHGPELGVDQARTTVVTTASPLLLDRCDEVAFLVAGRVAATGTHRELLGRHPGYRETVTRGEAG
jgi:ABC-type multidrug transport system fused ATPase/permease subunit